MTYKINYDAQTTLVLGKYPSDIYENAPEPNITISDSEYKRIFGDGLFQRPCVVNGVIQELVRPDSEILEEAKAAKIVQLNLNRDNANVANMVSHQAEEITVDEFGQDTKTGNTFYFSFTTKNTNNPATEPSTVINAVIRKGASDPNYYLRYSCGIIDGQTIRKGYIALTFALANSISDHAEIRNTQNIFLANTKEDEIKACTTIEQLNNINITF